MQSFNRIAYVQIAKQFAPETMASLKLSDLADSVEYKWETIRGLDIKFDITRPIYSLQSEAKISILGLSKDKIEQYASWGGEATVFKSATLIRVYAGYGDKDSDAKLIFEGNVINAMPTMPPDVWLNIQARTFTTNMAMSFTADISSAVHGGRTMKFGDYIDALCVAMKIDEDATNLDVDTADEIITTPTYDKPTTVSTVLGDFSKLCDSKNVIFYLGWQNDGRPIMVLEPKLHEDGYTPSQSKCITVSKETGMIGIPRMSFNNIEVTCLLNGNATNSLLLYADVRSRFAMPGMYDWNGRRTEDLYRALFRIINIRYHGHLRGNEWYATYTAQRDWQKSDSVWIDNSEDGD